MKKKQKIFLWIVPVISLLAVLSLGFALVESRSLGTVVERLVSDLFEDTAQVTFGESGLEGFLGDVLLGGMSEAVKGIGDEIQKSAGGLFLLYRVGLLIPALLALLSTGIVLGGKKRGKYMAAFGTSLAGALILGIVELLAIPMWISAYIRNLGIQEAFGDVLKMGDLMKVLSGALGIGFWGGLVFLVILVIVCLIGFCMKDGEEAPAAPKASPTQKAAGKNVPEERPFVQPVLRGIAGEYTGGTIPLRQGDIIRIGSNPGKCNLPLNGEGVAEVHCIVEFDRTRDCFLVRDFSEAGTYTNQNVRLKTGQQEEVERNSILVIGSDENIFMLE